jgi:hypothetical protein
MLDTLYIRCRVAKMELCSLHLLLTYECNFDCDHCFVWGSPKQTGTMTIRNLQEILRQGKEMGTVKSIFFEGGEPFLYHPVMVKGAQMAKKMGFSVGVLSNSYWANTVEDAMEWLRPLAGLVDGVSFSSDLYHYDKMVSDKAKNARAAARKLGINVGLLQVAQPEAMKAASVVGQLPHGESAVMFRGRAVEKLARRAAKKPWKSFTECPHEKLREPDRLHLDPLGNVHICQGIMAGNVFRKPLSRLCEAYDPDSHPIIGPLLDGGPAELVRHYELRHEAGYADACHLCYEARARLRKRFPQTLGPNQMYGVLK